MAVCFVGLLHSQQDAVKSNCLALTLQSLTQNILKKLKKRQKSAPHTSLERWPSNQQLNIRNGVVGNGHSAMVGNGQSAVVGNGQSAVVEDSTQPFRARSKTFTDGGKFSVWKLNYSRIPDKGHSK